MGIFEDHPRPRGDYIIFEYLFFYFLGSPPPTRGLPWMQANPGLGTRITPAHAGTTHLRHYK